jgi:branched-chain amino acid transport system substrate-binding protein
MPLGSVWSGPLRAANGIAVGQVVAQTGTISGVSGAADRPVHYIRGICSAYLMRDAMLASGKAGGTTGPGIKKALEQTRDHVPSGLEGVCLPTTFTPEDHRGSTTVNLYRNDHSYAGAHAQKVCNTTAPLRPDWLGS